MSAAHHRLLWLWGGLLAALLCLLFLPLTGGERGFAILLVAAAVTAGLVVAGRRPGESAEGEYGLNDLPDTPYRLPVVLVCGDTGDWPGESTVHRTAQGCWLKVSTVQLQQTVRHLLWRRPELVSQLAVMVCVCPQQHDDGALLTARLHELRWQLTRVRRDARRQVPLLLSGTLAGRAVTAPVWQSALPGEAIQVWQDGEAPQSAGVWLLQDAPPARLRTQILFSAHARFVSEEILPVLTGDNPDMPAVPPAMVLYHQTRSLKTPGERSLWQQFLTRHTALNHIAGWRPDHDFPPDGTGLPDFILPFLPQGEGRTPQSRMLRRAFCLFTLAALIALCSSAWNNRQLLHRLSFDVAHYYLIAITDRAPKADAVAVLRQDAALLNDWSRNGEPLRYGLGLYRGEQLRPAVLAAIQTYVPPPPPPPPVIKQVIQGPQTVRLDSMSLFDTGRYDLKPGSTKVLVNALVGIKAKPGWLIVIAGHTDNTGDEQSNQTLSLKRAESVRDWMRDTGDVPESCFAVQGYGESRPAATNDTAQGRALNRRVEISLVPQADACRIPATPASSQDDDALQNEME